MVLYFFLLVCNNLVMNRQFLSNSLSQTSSQVTEVIVLYYASSIYLAITFCFLLFQEIKLSPIKIQYPFEREGAFGNVDTGGAWLSSGCVVKGLVKSHNMQPSCLVSKIKFGSLTRLSVISQRKVRMTSSHHVPYILDDTCATMNWTKDRNLARVS